MNGSRPVKSKEPDANLHREAPHESEAALLEEPAFRAKKNQILSSRLVAQNADTRQTRGSDAGKSPLAAKITVVDRRAQSNFINADESIAIENDADVGLSTFDTALGGKPLALTDSLSKTNLVSFQNVKVAAKEKPEAPKAELAEQREPLYKTDRPKLSLSEVPSIQVSKPAAEEKSERRGRFDAFVSEQLSTVPRQPDKRFVRYAQPKTLHLPISPTVRPMPPAELDSADLRPDLDEKLASLESVQGEKSAPRPKIVVSQEELQTPLQLKPLRSSNRRESYETVLSPLRNKMKVKAPSQSAARGPVAQDYQTVPAQSRRLEEGSAQSRESSASADRNKPGLAVPSGDMKSEEQGQTSKKGILKNKKSAECVDSDSESAGRDARSGNLSPTSSNLQSVEGKKKREVRFNLIPAVQYVSFYIRRHGLHQSYRDDCCCCACTLI